MECKDGETADPEGLPSQTYGLHGFWDRSGVAWPELPDNVASKKTIQPPKLING